MKSNKCLLILSAALLLLGACSNGTTSTSSSSIEKSSSEEPWTTSEPTTSSSQAQPDTTPKFTKGYGFAGKQIMTDDFFKGSVQSGNEEVSVVSGDSVSVVGNIAAFIKAGDTKLHVKAAKGEGDCDMTIVDSGSFKSNEFKENATLVLNKDKTFTLSYDAHTWTMKSFSAEVAAFSGSGTWADYKDSGNVSNYLKLTFNQGTTSPFYGAGDLISIYSDKTSENGTMKLYVTFAVSGTDKATSQSLRCPHSLDLEIAK